MKDKLSVVIPAYNEEQSIARVIAEIKQSIKDIDYEIIVINDASKDSTASILTKIKDIKVITNPTNKGYGASLKKGIKEANGNYILIIDADETYPADAIQNLLKSMNKYDMVVGARNKKYIPFIRKPAKWFLTTLASFLANKKIPDLNSGLRIFKKDICLEFWNLYPERFSFTSTLTMAFLTHNYDVKYVPIDYYKRRGKSSIQPNDFVNFTKLLFKIVLYFNPLKVFSLLSILLFLIALMVFLYTKIVIGEVADITTIIITLSALQIFLFGILAELIVKWRIK